MKKSFAIVLLFISGLSAHAQKYYLSVSHETYSELSDAIDINMPWTDTVDNYAHVDIGSVENYKFFGQNYPFNDANTLGVSTLGNLKTSNTATTIIIDGYFTWLAPGPNTIVRYKMEGESGHRIIKVEYKNISFEKCDRNNTFVNFQIWLYQSGNIEVHYGPSSLCDSSHRGAAGPYVGLFRSNKDFSSFFNIFWLKGSAANPTTVNNDLPTVDGEPGNGTVYRISTTPTGLQDREIEFEQAGIAFPNPATNSISYTWTGKQTPKTVSIMDHTGRLILTKDADQKNVLDITDLPAGLYLMQVRSQNELQIFRFVKGN